MCPQIVKQEQTSIIQSTSLSKTVSYKFKEDAEGRTGEGLVASNRYYPGILYEGQFYSGLHKKNSFFPGVGWCDRFVPGLLTRRAFFPGLAMGKSFMPGIVAQGIFIPGIIVREHFVPGIIRNDRFLPGCFTADRRFVPGRFIDGSFQSGLLKDDAFQATTQETLAIPAAEELLKRGYGSSRIDRYSPVGGSPVRGVVIGTLDNRVAHLPYGMATNSGVILGGLAFNDTLASPDLYLELVEDLKELGYTIGDPNDPSTELNKVLGIDGGVAMAEKWLNDLLPDAFFGAGTGSAWGNLAKALLDAVDGLSAGANKLIDGLNSDWNDYWSSLLGSNPQGMITGSGLKTIGKYTAKGAGIGYAAGGVVGALAGAAIGFGYGVMAEATGADPVGKIIDTIEKGMEKVGEWIADAYNAIVHLFTDSGDGSGEGEEPGGTIGNVSAQPLMPFIDNRRTLIEIENEEANDFVPVTKVGKSIVRITHEDTGAMVIVDFNAIRHAAKFGGGQAVVGIDPVCGNTYYVPGRCDVHIDLNHIYDQCRMPFLIQNVAHPLGPDWE